MMIFEHPFLAGIVSHIFCDVGSFPVISFHGTPALLAYVPLWAPVGPPCNSGSDSEILSPSKQGHTKGATGYVTNATTGTDTVRLMSRGPSLSWNLTEIKVCTYRAANKQCCHKHRRSHDALEGGKGHRSVRNAGSAATSSSRIST